MKKMFVEVVRRNPKRAISLAVCIVVGYCALSQGEIAPEMAWYTRLIICLLGIGLAMPIINIIDRLLVFLDSKTHKIFKT